MFSFLFSVIDSEVCYLLLELRLTSYFCYVIVADFLPEFLFFLSISVVELFLAIPGSVHTYFLNRVGSLMMQGWFSGVFLMHDRFPLFMCQLL